MFNPISNEKYNLGLQVNRDRTMGAIHISSTQDLISLSPKEAEFLGRALIALAKDQKIELKRILDEAMGGA